MDIVNDDSDYGSSPSKIRKKDFFASLRKPKNIDEFSEVSNFLKELPSPGHLDQLLKFPTILRIFKYEHW